MQLKKRNTNFMTLLSSMLIFLYLIITAGCVSTVKANESSCFSKPKNETKCDHNTFLVTLLENAKNIIEDAAKYASSSTSYSDFQLTCDKPMDCYEISQNDPRAKSGVYMIWPRTRLTTNPIKAYCDMEDDSGGWTVLLRRGDFDSDPKYFYQGWDAYKKGFGDLEKDFWLGNDNMYVLTNQRPNKVKFTLSDWEGNNTYATYDEFYIDDEQRKYTCRVSNYRGTAGDSFSHTNGVPFSTKDRDHDTSKANCAELYKVAWWHQDCHAAGLTGWYLKGAHESRANGVNWLGFRGFYYSLKDAVIKIRPKDFQNDNRKIIP